MKKETAKKETTKKKTAPKKAAEKNIIKDENIVVTCNVFSETVSEVSEWKNKIKFRKQFFIGAREKDVWKKFEELNSMYEKVLKETDDSYNTFGNSGNLEEKLNEIVAWIKKIRFKKQPFGGVSERDIWRRTEQLNRMYEVALKELSVFYDTDRRHKNGG